MSIPPPGIFRVGTLTVDRGEARRGWQWGQGSVWMGMPRPTPKFRTPRPAAERASGPAPRGGAVPAPSIPRTQLLYGFHPVAAAFLNPLRRCRHVYLTDAAKAAFQDVIDRAAALGLSRPAPHPIDREAIERMLPPGAVHQGLALDAESPPEMGLEDILIAIGDRPATLVLLDQVTDPHNVGAILRSAAAFGAKAMIVQTRHAPEVTGVLAKAASGAVEIVPIVRETNLARAVESLRAAGFAVMGLDEKGGTRMADAALGDRVALALGAEGVGLRRLIAEGCDMLVSLPTVPPIGSLNVSNAAAVGLYEIARRRMR